MSLDYVILTNHRPHRRLLTADTTGHQLLTAIKHEQLSSVKQLVQTGVDVNQKGDNTWTSLTLACHLGKEDVVEYLLSHHFHDVTPNPQTSSNPTPCDINLGNDYGDTPLICAAREGHNSVVRLLLKCGADSNLANQYNSLTPLLVAIDNGHVEVVVSLLAYHADVQLTDNVKLTPLYTAIKLKDGNKRDIITQQIIQAECDVNVGSQDHAPIFLASRMGYLSIVKMLCEANCDVNVSNKYGVTPLYEAAIKGHNSVVSYLLSQGCQVNKQDMYGVSPLHAAAVFNNPTAVKMILKAGGSVRQRDHTGRCAVHAAMEKGFADVVQVFLCHGVDITQPPTSIKRLSSLVKVFEDCHTEVVKVLIAGCSKLPLCNCPAVMNVFRCNQELVEMLLLSGIMALPCVFAVPDHPSQHLLDPHVANCLNTYHKTPLSLQNVCRIQVRRCLKNKILHTAEMLPLPKKLKAFITFQTL